LTTTPALVVVLVEPAGPLNVGGVARLCANFGVQELRLVAPRCDHLGDEARRMAVHGAALLERATLFPNLTTALSDSQRVVATSGRSCGEPLPLETPGTALAWLRQAPPGSTQALVFGREDRGLTNGELLQAGRLLTIDTGASYGSLNLAQAAAIVLHRWQELGRSDTTPQPPGAAPPAIPQQPEAGGPMPEPSARGALEAMLRDAEELLLEVGFLYPHTARARMARVRQLLQRGQVSQEEVALLRGMVRQLRWASRQGGARTPQTP
jgi:tRNA/rRNA methyltransferase